MCESLKLLHVIFSTGSEALKIFQRQLVTAACCSADSLGHAGLDTDEANSIRLQLFWAHTYPGAALAASHLALCCSFEKCVRRGLAQGNESMWWITALRPSTAW